MRSAILGLRKRETYDEIINDLNHDPIRKYPDRTASQIENSNYLSQLRGGIEQMIIQSDNIMKQKQKELLLQEEAGSQPHSHHEHVIHESSHPPPPPPPPPTPPTPDGEEYQTPIYMRVPVGQPREYAPDHYTPMETEPLHQSPTVRVWNNRNSPMITQRFNIGTPRSRSSMRPRYLAHDVDDDAQQAHEMMIEDEEMQHARDEELREHFVEASRLMLHDAQNQSIEDIMTGRGDKRREEGADPKPAKPKAKTAPKREASPKASPSPKPKAKAQSSSASSASTEAPSSKAKAKPIPVKKTSVKASHGTSKQNFNTPEEWMSNPKAMLVDQYNARKIGTYISTKSQIKKVTKQWLVDKIIEFDRNLRV